MRWLHTEYLLKGVYLGLMLYAAVQLSAFAPPDWDALTRVNLCTLAGLALALVGAGILKVRQGYRPRGRPLFFTLFLLLESPTFVYAGILGGTLVGVWLVRRPELENLLPTLALGGAAAGLAFGALRQIKDAWTRLGLVLALAAGLVAGVLYWFKSAAEGGTLRIADPTLFSTQLLLGIPFFYLLTFAGVEEESEFEIAAMCAALGLGLQILVGEQVNLRYVVVLLPLLLYFGYTLRVLPGLRVFKHAVRGLSFARVGRVRRALLSFRRALQLDPNNALAREGFWDLHRNLDVERLLNDPQTLQLVDLGLCVERAGTLLVSPSPAAKKMDEAQRLLDLVVKLRPAREPSVAYWRSVALLHQRDIDRAATTLESVLDPAKYGADNPHRQSVLTQAWQLALLLHDEMRRRVGEPQLTLPGRRMEAIAAVERYLAEAPEDEGGRNLKRLLYRDLTEADYDTAAAPPHAAEHFDHFYAQHLGMHLIEDAERWQRGAEYLRLAARGLPGLAPSIHVQIAKAHLRADQQEGAEYFFLRAREAGRAVGVKTLGDAERNAFFATVKYLGELAAHRGDLDAAVENLQMYTEYEKSGIETYRTLADLHAQRGDMLAAARAVDQGLVYNPKDADLLKRKDDYYYSIDPEQLKARLETYGLGFDVAYCVRRAKGILDDRRLEGMEWLDVSRHLVSLACVAQPASLQVRVLHARILMRCGERDEATAILEAVRSPKPERFGGADEEDAWYTACQQLADLHLEAGRADRAVECLLDFKKSPKSGARTLYRLGESYEQLGDAAKAVKFYQQVTAYDGNPLAYDAQEAIRRLQR